MTQLFVIGEDSLCCALGSKLATVVLGWNLAQPAVNANGVTKLRSAIPRYLGLTNMHPVLCIADTDNGCAMRMTREWLPANAPENFLLRFAVAESESWLIADNESIATFLRVPEARVPRNPDDEPDAKQTLLGLARQSGRREIRDEVVSRNDVNKQGPGYNVHLSDFVANHWRPREAAARSPSLTRAIARLEVLGTRRQ